MSGSRPFESYRSPNTGVNALVGGVFSILFGFVPFSPLFGGFVAGYLQEGDRNAALRTGAFAGLVALAPLVLVGGLFALLATTGIAIGQPRLSVVFMLVVLVAAMLSIVYTVGLSAAGGYLGAIVAEDYEK